ncbi:SDR family NAD(P)-dependent oxidoreductase [Nonomuraea glycinis]|uniref:SDR family NAD(P)-dependent oxidoreductase n=1 Tax=Nonomuraea glycinis TaxID=2047744 RepID=UPI001CD9F867|nr:SDR family NAD(P)-dependent oxidoreductase [Nonomuraea glycinis]MCA2180076.1 SDR family NAD(P)-dependent oxidoreductase [Nonomuraea glycinis]
MRFDDHRVVITAAGRDLGRTLAIRLADLGAEVFLSARSLAATEHVRDEICDRGHRQVHAYACNLTDPASTTGSSSSAAPTSAEPNKNCRCNCPPAWPRSSPKQFLCPRRRGEWMQRPRAQGRWWSSRPRRSVTMRCR